VLTGTSPWTLSYQTIQDGVKTPYVVKDIVDSRITLSIPPFEKSGTVVVDLLGTRLVFILSFGIYIN
jgi:hypothetical protein